MSCQQRLSVFRGYRKSRHAFAADKFTPKLVITKFMTTISSTSRMNGA